LISFALTALLIMTGCGFDGAPADDLVPPPNVEPLVGCAIACHGDGNSSAPPRGLEGEIATTTVAVGAHQTHMRKASTWHMPINCADCHVVPDAVNAVGHIDADGKAEVIFSMRAGANSTWTGTSCTTRCHGSTALGGSKPNPIWTQVDGTQVKCGSCHGTPPPAPHPPTGVGDCSTCHPTMEVGSMRFRDPAKHINGIVETDNNVQSCSACHGGPTSAAPPKALDGATARTDAGVGAHAAHQGVSAWHREIACASCHKVPATTVDADHIGATPDNRAELRFDSLNPMGAYTFAQARCSNLYCHGNGRRNNGQVNWTTVGTLNCDACHRTNGDNMSGEHRKHLQKGVQCVGCHIAVVRLDRTFVDPNLHINGAHEVNMAEGTYDPGDNSCINVGCHKKPAEEEDWD
jgi:predicted CxxxxCH...CXXCH cytochrome family protein